MPIKAIRIVTSVTEYLKTIHRVEFSDYMWYRGQRFSEYQLEPSLFRDKIEIPNDDPYLLKRVRYIVKSDFLALKEFKTAYKKQCGDKNYGDIYYLCESVFDSLVKN